MSCARTFRALGRRRSRKARPSASDRMVANLALHGVDRDALQQVDCFWPEPKGAGE